MTNAPMLTGLRIRLDKLFDYIAPDLLHRSTLIVRRMPRAGATRTNIRNPAPLAK
jgi:hypothetical protein